MKSRILILCTRNSCRSQVAEATGTEKEVLAVFRRVLDEIKIQFQKFYTDDLSWM